MGIQQHAQEYRPGYDYMLMPCGCQQDQEGMDTLHVMWVKTQQDGPMNHFVALVAKGKRIDMMTDMPIVRE